MIDEEFYSKINELYEIILQPIDNRYKIISIKKYKNKLNIFLDHSFGEKYIELCNKDKSLGTVYTPKAISQYIVKNVIKKEEIIKNPFVKILDPSCGCGNILIPCYKYLRKIYIENLDYINMQNNLNLNEENLSQHIVKNNIYGIDIDKMAIKILIIDLLYESGFKEKNNFKHCDFLTTTLNEKYDIVIGNPPYIGHKLIGKEYFKKLKDNYKEVYNNKGDMSYCFFKAALLNLKDFGRLGFITSRYFIESQSGKKLRNYLSEKFNILKIVDFYGIRPFKGTGIDPVIIFLQNKMENYNKDIEIIKPKYVVGNMKNKFYDSLFNLKGKDFKKFYINENNLNNEGWILRPEREMKIIEKINNKSNCSLKDVCNSYQGIITGCDKAFIVTKEQVLKEKLERDIIKPWIKSSYIEKNYVKDNLLYIIYSNNISNINNYSNIKNHIYPFKDKLLKRRECRNGIRKWYELQWGRDKKIFENPKIIFPYKSSTNRFALDRGSYFSADVYSLVLKEKSKFTYDMLLSILNSDLYEFYFKSFGKKLGENIYEYYPNTIMKINLPNISKIKEFKSQNIYDYFELSKEEIEIIKSGI